MKLIIKLIIILAVISCMAHAQTFEQQVREIVNQLNKIDSYQHDIRKLPRARMREIHDIFERATALIKEIASAQMNKRIKKTHIKNLTKALGRAFVQLTQPFTDAVELRDFQVLQTRGYGYFKRKFLTVWRFTQFFFASVMHDIRDVPNVFSGHARRRAKLAKQIMQMYQTLFSADIRGINLSYGAALELLENALESEPVAYGKINRMMFHIYMGMAVYFFLAPPCEFVIERTTASPLLFGALPWMGAAITFAKVRSWDSGLGAFRVFRRLKRGLLKLTKQHQNLCARYMIRNARLKILGKLNK